MLKVKKKLWNTMNETDTVFLVLTVLVYEASLPSDGDALVIVSFSLYDGE